MDPNSTDAHGRAIPGTVVIGARPAGLTAAYDLTKHGCPVRVYESAGVVGGVSRAAERDGWRFDIGGRRFFFAKVAAVEALWHEILPDVGEEHHGEGGGSKKRATPAGTGRDAPLMRRPRDKEWAAA